MTVSDSDYIATLRQVNLLQTQVDTLNTHTSSAPPGIGTVTLAMMANIATQTFIGRNSAGTGVPEALSVGTAKSMLGLSGTNSGDQTITLTGDVTGSGTGSFAATISALAVTTAAIAAGAVTTAKIATSAVTLALMENRATQTFIGRNTAGSGVPEELSIATAKTMLGLTGTNSGDVTLAGENYLTIAGQVITAAAVDLSGTNATGVLAAARFPALTGDVTTASGALATTIGANKVTLAMMATVSTARFLGRTTAGTGNVESLTATQATAMLNVIAASTKGLAPAPGGSPAATNYLNETGAWTVPAGSVTGTGAANQVAYWSGTTVLTSSSALTWDTKAFILTPVAGVGAGIVNAFQFNGAANTVASVEWFDVYFNLARSVQINLNVAEQRFINTSAPTIIAASPTTTVTTAVTFNVAGPPVAGTNVVITNPYSFQVESGNANFGGAIFVSPATVSGGASAVIVTRAGSTAIGAEVIDVKVDLSTSQQINASYATERAMRIIAPAYTGSAATKTITTAATLAISDAPSASSNAAITTAYALWVESGNSLLAGGLNVGTATGATTGDVIASGKIETSSGTWTPAFTGTTIAGTFTYTRQTGFYKKIGNLVYIWADMIISAISVAPTGNMTITGLPFTSENVTGSVVGVTFGLITQFKYTTSSLLLLGNININSTVIALQDVFTNAATAAYPAANFTNAATRFIYSAWYKVP